jgi:magnesium transporter
MSSGLLYAQKDYKNYGWFLHTDWIAHDILDSIVDSFFPFLEYIETEAMAIDNTVFSGTLDSIIPTESRKMATMISGLTKRTRINTNSQLDEKYTDNQELEDEKSQSSPRPRFVAPYLTVSLAYHRTKRFVSNAWKSCTWRTKIEPPATPTSTPSQLTLRRIGSTRKLVTSLVRLLATKSDVLTAFRKRLLRASTPKLKSMTARSSEELAIYTGDVQG